MEKERIKKIVEDIEEELNIRKRCLNVRICPDCGAKFSFVEEKTINGKHWWNEKIISEHWDCLACNTSYGVGYFGLVQYKTYKGESRGGEVNDKRRVKEKN